MKTAQYLPGFPKRSRVDKHHSLRLHLVIRTKLARTIFDLSTWPTFQA